MTDAELYTFCQRYPVSAASSLRITVYLTHRPHQNVNRHIIDIEHFMDAAKVSALEKVLEDSGKENKRILLFSQVSLLRRLESQRTVTCFETTVYSNARHSASHPRTPRDQVHPF